MAKEERIGNPNRNLVLRTSGSIKVLVGDKYYSLKYSNSEEEEDTETKTENEFIISQDPIDFYLTGQLAYPGDNKVIFVGDCVEKFLDKIIERLGNKVIKAPINLIGIRGSSVILKALEIGEKTDAKSYVPNYLKEPFINTKEDK